MIGPAKFSAGQKSFGSFIMNKTKSVIFSFLLLLIFILFSSIIASAQSFYKPLSKDLIDEDSELKGRTLDIKNFPPLMLPKNIKNILLLELLDDSEKEDIKQNVRFKLIVQDINDNYLLVKDLKFAHLFRPREDYAYFKNGIIHFGSNLRGAYICEARYRWNGKTALFIKEVCINYSKDELREARRLLASGKLLKAIDAYNNILYPQFYMDRNEVAALILKSAQQLSRQARNPKQALKLMQAAYQFEESIHEFITRDQTICQEEFNKEKISKYISLKNYLSFINDYAALLAKVGDEEEAKKLRVQINNCRTPPTALHR
jgi:hypothetical protein